MKVALIITREGFPREYHGVFMDTALAMKKVNEMNKVVKKDKYEAVLLPVEG